MARSAILVFLFFIQEVVCYGQVKIRLFTGQSTGSVTFSVTEGNFELCTFNSDPVILETGSLMLISRAGEKLAIKSLNEKGFLCDSVFLRSTSGSDKFSLRVNGRSPVRRFYSGDLKCLPDMEDMVLINICDIDAYIAGVVRAEGGEKKDLEYFKTQAVIARTYMYSHFDKHVIDGYNLCDNTHCQAFNGITTDSMIIRAANETGGLVILGPDSALIISAFHSNCGGETAASEDVWLTNQSYLTSVIDPYCLASRNALWQKILSKEEWIGYLEKSGYDGDKEDPRLLIFSQQNRMKNLTIGNFLLPLRKVREDLNLRSSFFSISERGDSVTFSGKGYGHGVGLCQEGAMVMASKGFDFKKIISFYYKGVRIADIKDAVPNKN